MTEQVTTSSDSDELLVRAIAGGNAAALQTLYARHGPAILAYLIGRLQNQSLAEEVLQDVMLAVWKGAASFRGESKVRTWLLVIAHNRVVTAQQQLLKQRRKLPTTNFEMLEVEQSGDSLNELLELKEEHQELFRAIQKLPDDQRLTLELIFYHELSASETAQVLNIAVGTVKSRLHRAKAALRQLLEDKSNG